jgi:hypothetical protein
MMLLPLFVRTSFRPTSPKRKAEFGFVEEFRSPRATSSTDEEMYFRARFEFIAVSAAPGYIFGEGQKPAGYTLDRADYNPSIWPRGEKSPCAKYDPAAASSIYALWPSICWISNPGPWKTGTCCLQGVKTCRA